jgi:hypothetical protein
MEIDVGIFVTIVRRCKWLAKKPSTVRERICSAKRYQRLYSEKEGFGPASVTCFDTCAPFCAKQLESAKFVLQTIVQIDGTIKVDSKQCKWLANKDQSRIDEICANTVDYDGYVYGQASKVCTELCASC